MSTGARQDRSGRLSSKDRCFICGLVRGGSGVQMCRICGPAFDRAMERDDGTLNAMMQWTAARARQFALREKRNDERR